LSGNCSAKMLTHKIGFSLPLSISVNLGDKKKDAAA
jgi:hypothetical protein